MKKLLLIGMLMLSICVAFALVSEYTFAQSAQTYTEITGGTVVNSGATDDTQFAITLPFAFTFNEAAVTVGAMSSNGYLSFGGGTSSFGYTAIASTAVGTGVIAPLSRDLQGGATGEMRWEVFGTAPNRYVVYQWKNYRAYGGSFASDTWNFQVILYETTNQIALRYGAFTWVSTFTGTVQAGLRGATNADFKNRTTTTSWMATTAGGLNNATLILNSTIKPDNGLQFLFVPPIAGSVPQAAALISPSNGAINVAQTATLNWASGGGGPTGYKLQYGTNAAADNIMPLTNLGNVTTYDPAGLLTYDQTYYWKVVPYNTFGDATTSVVWSFTAMANPVISTFPWSVDFAVWPALNWSQLRGVYGSTPIAGTAWYQDDFGNVTTPVNKAAGMNIWSVNYGWLVSPPIAVPATGYELKFDIALTPYASTGIVTPGGQPDDKFIVLVDDNPMMTSPTILREWNNSGSPYVYDNVSNTGENHVINLNAYTGTVYFAFYGESSISNGDNDFFVDNVVVRQTPAGAPDAVTITNPMNGATGLPRAGFNIIWSPAVTGGTPTYYAVYLSMDEANIYGDYYFETTGTSLNPTTFAGGPSSPIMFNYDQRWYYTVEAVNASGSAVIEPARWFQIESDPSITIPHTQAFDGASIPAGWTQTFSGTVTSNRWTLSPTANAGGTANEMMETWVSGIGITRLITPPINTTGIANFAVSFNTLYDDYGVGVTAKVQYSHDLVTWYDTAWSAIGGGGNVSGLVSVLVTGLVNQPVTYVAWVMEGDHYQFDYWYIDNVNIINPPLHDVAPLSWDVMQEVVPANTVVTPMVTVINNGISTETFTVTVTIGTYSQTQTVTGLTSGSTAQVTFPSFIPELWTAENVVITTNLATDLVPGNDVLNAVLISLDLDVPALANNAQTDQFVQFNLSDPTTLVPLPTPYTGPYFMAGADWMNGRWMAVEYDDGTLATDNYYEIDPLTGAYLPSLGETGASLMGIAYDDDNSILYGVGGTNGTLYTMNQTNGLATPVAVMWFNDAGTPITLPNLGGLMIGIAYDNLNNILYGIDLGNDVLWTINVTTAELTLIGFLGVNFNFAQDCAFDQTNGMLYLAGYSTFGGLYWIDTLGGGAYLIDQFGTAGYELDGFAIPYGTLSIPSPTISATGQLSWAPVAGDVHYQIYKSTDPYGTYLPYATVYGTTWTDPLFAEGMAFYRVAAVGGIRSAHQNVQFTQPREKYGKLGQTKPSNPGIAR